MLPSLTSLASVEVATRQTPQVVADKLLEHRRIEGLVVLDRVFAPFSGAATDSTGVNIDSSRIYNTLRVFETIEVDSTRELRLGG